MEKNNKAQSVSVEDIEHSLEQTSRAITDLRNSLRPPVRNLPAPVSQVEKRLHQLQKEADELSSNMLSYKLKRIADSKMLSQASEAMRSAEKPVEYQSATFRCKSDLDKCLLDARSGLDKALCYALFIRCAFKS